MLRGHQQGRYCKPPECRRGKIRVRTTLLIARACVDEGDKNMFVVSRLYPGHLGSMLALCHFHDHVFTSDCSCGHVAIAMLPIRMQVYTYMCIYMPVQSFYDNRTLHL